LNISSKFEDGYEKSPKNWSYSSLEFDLAEGEFEAETDIIAKDMPIYSAFFDSLLKPRCNWLNEAHYSAFFDWLFDIPHILIG
jgi:hypothetical protein